MKKKRKTATTHKKKRVYNKDLSINQTSVAVHRLSVYRIIVVDHVVLFFVEVVVVYQRNIYKRTKTKQ